jgi:ELMO/CED-12 family
LSRKENIASSQKRNSWTDLGWSFEDWPVNILCGNDTTTEAIDQEDSCSPFSSAFTTPLYIHCSVNTEDLQNINLDTSTRMKQQNLEQNDKSNAKDTNDKNVNGKKSNWWVPQGPPTNLPFFQPKFSLPDKNVASQVLMYRQLLHTSCRPGLRLSRPYEGTVAQKAVLHMPWWERGIEDSGKMVITYDNLIVRLWMHGAILPFADLMGTPVDAMIGEDGLPPIPHPYWVDRLGFQQPDPVTDFRSGGVLSLALMVHM